MARRDIRNNRVKKVKKFKKRMKIKQMYVFVVIILALAILGIRVSIINYKSEDDYTKLVLEQQQESSTTIPFKRGDILDRNGNVLATSIKVYNLILDPKVMLTKEDYLEPTVKALLSNFEEIKEDDLRKVISEKADSSYVVYLKELEYERIENFLSEQNKNKLIKGVWFEDEYKRCYPYNELASGVIGFTEKGNAGRWGIEEFYNDFLNGTNGRRYSYVDKENQQVVEEKDAENGCNVISTIDMNLQEICQKWCETWDKEYNPKNVAIMLADPNNGDILAMVSSKNIYDLNNPRDLSRYYKKSTINKMSDKKQFNAMNKMWRNYCVSDTYQAGSTIKPFTIAGALEEKKIDFEDKFMCDGGETVAGRYIGCHLRSGHGQVSVEQAIMQSCNDALMQIAEKETIPVFTKYQSIFNFGMKTGIDLPGETSCAGLLYTEDNMTEIDLKTNAIGQNFNVTMVQMVAVFSSLINGGYYYQPHVLKQVVSPNGAIEENFDKVLVKQTITDETSDFIRKSLMNVTIGGTGRTAQVQGYLVGGKTGTAQKQNKEEDEYILSFLGYASYEKPRVVCYVLVDAPDVPDPGSSSYASKLFSAVMTEVLPAMDIYPSADEKEPETTKSQVTTSPDENAANAAGDDETSSEEQSSESQTE